MRAWQVVGAGEPEVVLREAELDVPQPGPNQVRIAVTAAGIGLPDVLMCRGTYPLTPPLPFTPGQEVTGVVTATGDGVELAVGQRVMAVSLFWQGTGSFADECLLDASNTFAVPAGLDDAAAAGFWIPNMTAWIGLVERGHIVQGDWLVVLGAAGGSGIAAVQLGRALGARVVAVVGGEQKAGYCRRLGADVTIDHHSGVDLAEAIRDATDGHGADLVYDPVGGDAAERATRALARNGRLLAVGFASGRWPVIATHDLVVANTSVVGVFAGGHSRDELDIIHSALSALVADGHLHDAITDRVAWGDLPQALQRMAAREVIGKQVLLS